MRIRRRRRILLRPPPDYAILFHNATPILMFMWLECASCSARGSGLPHFRLAGQLLCVSVWAVGCYWTVWLFSLLASKPTIQTQLSTQLLSKGIYQHICPCVQNTSIIGESWHRSAGSEGRYNAFFWGLISARKQRWRWRRRFHIRSTEEKAPPLCGLELLVSVYRLFYAIIAVINYTAL